MNWRTDEIRQILVNRVDQQEQAVGIVVGLVGPGGRTVVAHGHLARGDPRVLDGDTIFEIGSVSKVFTSLLLADLVRRGGATLDDPAAKYLPEKVRMPGRGGKSITLLDLATHTSGLPRLPSNLKPKNLRNPYADYTEEDLHGFLSSYTLPRDPGSKFEYSNLGGGLLGHLLARHAGLEFENLIESRITRPLGMQDTGITLTPSMEQRMATGHTALLVPAARWDFQALAGAGALRSCANDMLTFLDAFLGYKESPLAPAMNTMLEVRRPAGQLKIGLGWLVLSTDNREIAWHNGGTGGFRSFVGCDPKERLGVVVLSNAGGVDDIGFHLLNPKLPLAGPYSPGPHSNN